MIPLLTIKDIQALTKLGITKEHVTLLINKPIKKISKKKFNPTPKKFLRLIYCRFCGKTEVIYFLMEEISLCTWEGHRVSKKKYLETKGILSKPSKYTIKFCKKCPEYIDEMSEEGVRKLVLNLIWSQIGEKTII